MKKLSFLLCSLMLYFSSFSQAVYIPSKGSVTAKPIAPSAGVPTDARSYFYDSLNFRWRPYLSTAEVLSFLSSQTLRRGHFPIIVNTGGTLLNGVVTGGTNQEYWFKDGVTNNNLVLKSSTANSGTVAQLRSLSTTTGQVYFPSDFGGGRFIDRGLNDGVHTDDSSKYIITVNGHLLERETEGKVNVKYFKATGSGVADETQAIQAAVNFASGLDNATVPDIVFPSGRYRITGSGVKVMKTMNIIAEGEVIILLDGMTPGQYAFSLIDSANLLRKASLQGFTFWDNSASGVKNAIFIRSHDNLITGNKFNQVNEGIKIDTYNGNIIQDNYFFGHKTGVYLWGFANETHINQNRFFGGQLNGASIKLNDVAATAPLQNVYINENWFENNGSPDIFGRVVSGVRISGFWSEDFTQVFSSPRIDIDNSGYDISNVIIDQGRIVVKAGTRDFIRINAQSVQLSNFDVFQQNEIPSVDLAQTKFATLKNIRFSHEQAERASLGFGVNVRGGVNVEDLDKKDFATQKWAMGGVQLRPGKNQFTNSTFKSPHTLVAGGVAPGTVVNDTTTGVFDSSSVKIVFPANTGFISASHVRTNDVFTVATGENIKIAFWAKTSGRPVRVLANIAGTTAPPSTDIYLSKEWKKFFISADSLAGGYYYLYLSTNITDTAITMWLDDIQGESGKINDFSVYVTNNSNDVLSFGKGVLPGREAVGGNEMPTLDQVKKLVTAPASPVNSDNLTEGNINLFSQWNTAPGGIKYIKGALVGLFGNPIIPFDAVFSPQQHVGFADVAGVSTLTSLTGDGFAAPLNINASQYNFLSSPYSAQPAIQQNQLVRLAELQNGYIPNTGGVATGKITSSTTDQGVNGFQLTNTTSGNSYWLKAGDHDWSNYGFSLVDVAKNAKRMYFDTLGHGFFYAPVSGVAAVDSNDYPILSQLYRAINRGFDNTAFTLRSANGTGYSLFTSPSANSGLLKNFNIGGVGVSVTVNNDSTLNFRVGVSSQTVTSAASVTPDANFDNGVKILAQSVPLTIANPTGSPQTFQKLIIRIRDNGNPQPITWGSDFRPIGVTLPTTTVAGQLLYVEAIANLDEGVGVTKWDIYEIHQQGAVQTP